MLSAGDAPGSGLGYSRSDGCVDAKVSRDCWRPRRLLVTSARGEAPGRVWAGGRMPRQLAGYTRSQHELIGYALLLKHYNNLITQ